MSRLNSSSPRGGQRDLRADLDLLKGRGVTPDRITEIRRQIAAGTYLTEDKLEVAIERLHAALCDAPRREAAAG